jgi:gliding motility-associated-like protein
LCLTLHQKIIAQKPTAAFAANFTSGCSPLVVQFTDASTGNPTEWKWDLGNGGISTSQNPSAAYLNPGTYTVTLTVSNAQGTDSITKVNFITVYAKPTVQFTSSIASGCLPLNVQFTDKSSAGSGTISQEAWDFGDGSIGKGPDPLHTYNFAGLFGVTLTVTNSFGCSQTLEEPSQINVPSPVTAAFNYTYANACEPPVNVTFTNLSVSPGNTLSYKWLFGDGGNSVQLNPSYTYNSSGTFNIELIATSNQGCTDTVTKSISIGTVTPNFTVSPTTACTNVPFIFTNTSSPIPVSAAWTFGDGGISAQLSPTYSYASAGTYQVTMNAVFGACSGSISKTVVVVDKPKAGFNITGTTVTGCGIPATVQFGNTSTGATSYQWIFGDGDSSSAVNPSHTYTQGGLFAITLIAYNSNGCSDTFTLSNPIKLGAPQINSFVNLPIDGCVPLTVPFVANITSSQPIVSYFWSFGDGTTSTDSATQHTYTKVGSYSVKLVIVSSGGCSDSLTLQNAVQLGVKPQAGFTGNPLIVCGNNPIQFTDTSKGTITNWQWYFGNIGGAGSTQQNPSTSFGDTGHYNITLIVSDNGCSDTLTKLKYIYVAPPIAKFYFHQNCAAPFTKSFADLSIAPLTWAWTFGDGDTSSVQNPVHTYSATGAFYVTLVVTNNGCTSTASDSIYVINEHPSYTYTPADTSLCRFDSVRFTANSYNPRFIKSFYWNFGDGTNTGFTSQSSVTHMYDSAGNFLSQLITQDLNGCKDTISKTAALFHVYGPTAAFSNPPGTCIGGNIVFTDSSTSYANHPIVKWVWQFGDNTSQTATSPPFQHTYDSAGTFPVELTVYDSYGCKDTLLINNDVLITDPSANFSISDSIKCSNNMISFSNLAAGASLTYLWNFGNGATSTQFDPVYSYSAEGIYSIELLVTDRFGCKDSMIKPKAITISNPQAIINLQDTFATCPPFLVQPKSGSSSYTSLVWNFGDGNSSNFPDPSNAYNQAGSYDLELITQGYGTCADTAYKKITVQGPSGTLTYLPYKGCAPSTVSFLSKAINTDGYIWDFNNGVIQTTSGDSIQYTYTTYGEFVPKLILFDNTGCKVSVQNPDTIKIAQVIAGMNINPKMGCDSSFVSFTNSSTAYSDTITSYSWNFGDSDTSSAPNPNHTYFKTGTYDISLIATTGSGCRDTVITPELIQVNPNPEITFKLPDSVCINSLVQFSAADKINDTSSVNWRWNFGNGTIINAQDSETVFTTSGIFNALITAIDKYGCRDSGNQPITVLPPPHVYVGPDTVICLGGSVLLNPSGANNYAWNANSTLSCDSCITPLAKPDTTTTYYVKGQTLFGCTAKDSVTVQVKMPFKLTLSAADTLCIGGTTTLQASGSDIYQWSPGDFLSSTTSAQPLFTASMDTSILYTVIGHDDKNCFADTGTVRIKVYPIPKVQILQTAITMNVGESVQLNSNSSSDVTQWRWTPETGLNNATLPSPVASPQQSTTYTVVATNNGQCVSRDQVVITVLCNGANIFVPNTFSPNGDGMNDVFFPRGKGLFNVKSMMVFNRWGQVVFERENFGANDASYGWDGTYNGQPMPSDVYVYIMQVVCNNNIVVPVKGNVALLR